MLSHWFKVDSDLGHRLSKAIGLSPKEEQEAQRTG